MPAPEDSNGSSSPTPESAAPAASLADYFAAQSRGALTVEGGVAEVLRLPHPREHYSELPMGAPQGSLYSDAAIAVAVRDGLHVTEGFDGVAFLHAGEPETRPSRALWPHGRS